MPTDTPSVHPVPPEALAAAVGAVLQQVAPSQAAEHLGEAFMACEHEVRERPDEFREALESGRLQELLVPTVSESLRSERPECPRGGWLGLYVGPDGRPTVASAVAEGADLEAMEITGKALNQATARARAGGNATLLRYLGWYRERLAHMSYEAIAKSSHAPPATIRTGVARARKLVLRTVHELQQAQPAPLTGAAPPAVEPLRRLWTEQKLDALEAGLEETRAEHAGDPHWLNLAALLAADRGRSAEAVELYHRGLVYADAPSVRGRLLNNLGNLADDQGDPDEAQRCWLRARQLVPDAPAPLVNLLALASLRRDYASAQHHLSELADLMSSGRLAGRERAYALRRLREHPRLRWLRQTDAWRNGPERWLRRRDVRRTAAASSALALLIGLLLAFGAFRDVSDSLPGETAAVSRAAPTLGASPSLLARGGDSMGKSQPTSGKGSRRGRRRNA